MEYQIGEVVKSRAGRDRDHFFLVVGTAPNGRPLLCDGKLRPLERPKQKNPLHLQRTNRKLPVQSIRTNRELYRTLYEHSADTNEEVIECPNRI